jgi:hypothetical protein
MERKIKVLNAWGKCAVKMELFSVLDHLTDDTFCKREDAIRSLLKAIELVNEEEQSFY